MIRMELVTSARTAATAVDHATFALSEVYADAARKVRKSDWSTFDAVARALRSARKEIDPLCSPDRLVTIAETMGDHLASASRAGASISEALSIVATEHGALIDRFGFLAPVAQARLPDLPRTPDAVFMLSGIVAASAYERGLPMIVGHDDPGTRDLYRPLAALAYDLRAGRARSAWPNQFGPLMGVLSPLADRGWCPTVLLAASPAGTKGRRNTVARLVCRIDGSSAPDPFYRLGPGKSRRRG